MNKRKLHHLLVVLRPINYWYFVVIFLVSSFIAAYTLRQNNIRAIELRENVLKVDKENGDVEAALRELREYTYGHMNANLASDTGIYPPVQLKYRYERLVAEEQNKAQSQNKDLYNEAQEYCETHSPEGFYGASRLPCVSKYLDDHGKPEAKPHDVPDSLYKFDFVAPVWSPDLAGWSIVVAVIALFLLITRIVAQVWIKHQLND